MKHFIHELISCYFHAEEVKREITSKNFGFLLFFDLILISHLVFGSGVVVKVKDVEHSICHGPMERNVLLDIGVSMANVYHEIDKRS